MTPGYLSREYPSIKDANAQFLRVHAQFVRADTQFQRANTRLWETYVHHLSTLYEQLTPKKQEEFRTGLESLVAQFDQVAEPAKPYQPDTAANKPKYERSTRKQPDISERFNPKQAKKVREKEGLSMKGLAAKLGLEPSWGSSFCKYEKGNVVPQNPPRGKGPKKYLRWLKEHGYNPYRI